MGCSASKDEYPSAFDLNGGDDAADGQPLPLRGTVQFRSPVSSKYAKHTCVLEDGKLAYRRLLYL